MMSLLWLITSALGLRMLYAMRHDVRRLTRLPVSTALVTGAALWIVFYVRTIVWFMLQP